MAGSPALVARPGQQNILCLRISSASPFSLAAQTATNVELWDENDDRLVARQVVPPSAGPQEIEIPFQIGEYRRPVGSYAGWGPFRIFPIPVPLDEVKEVRVRTPAHGEVSVYSITMRRKAPPARPEEFNRQPSGTASPGAHRR